MIFFFRFTLQRECHVFARDIKLRLGKPQNESLTESVCLDAEMFKNMTLLSPPASTCPRPASSFISEQLGAALSGILSEGKSAAGAAPEAAGRANYQSDTSSEVDLSARILRQIRNEELRGRREGEA